MDVIGCEQSVIASTVEVNKSVAVELRVVYAHCANQHTEQLHRSFQETLYGLQNGNKLLRRASVGVTHVEGSVDLSCHTFSCKVVSPIGS